MAVHNYYKDVSKNTLRQIIPIKREALANPTPQNFSEGNVRKSSCCLSLSLAYKGNNKVKRNDKQQ